MSEKKERKKVRNHVVVIKLSSKPWSMFRWKGENVSTAEVEVTVSRLLEGRGVVAYGVQVQTIVCIYIR